MRKAVEVTDAVKPMIAKAQFAVVVQSVHSFTATRMGYELPTQWKDSEKLHAQIRSLEPKLGGAKTYGLTVTSGVPSLVKSTLLCFSSKERADLLCAALADSVGPRVDGEFKVMKFYDDDSAPIAAIFNGSPINILGAYSTEGKSATTLSFNANNYYRLLTVFNDAEKGLKNKKTFIIYKEQEAV